MRRISEEFLARKKPGLCLLLAMLFSLSATVQGEEEDVEYFTSAKQADSGLLAPGTPTVDMTFLIDDASAGLVVVTSPSKTLQVSLIDPNMVETPIGSTGPGVTGSGTYPEDADTNPLVTGKDYIFRLEMPMPGTWTVRVTETVGPTEDTPVVVNLWLASDIQGLMVGGGQIYPTGSEVTFGIFMTDATGALAGYSVAATIFRLGDPTFTPTTVTFADDGISPDFTAGDGMYTGSLILTEAGTYDLQAIVTGTTGGGTAYRRDLYAQVEVVAPLASLVPGTVTDQGVDTNGNGLFDFIEVGINVDAVTGGDYNVWAHLRSAGGNEVSANALVTLPMGITTVAVPFDEETIRDLGENGPYDITRIQLEAIINDAPETQDILFDVGQTAAYQLDQLERDPILFTGSTDFGNDCDADGDFDTLVIDLEVDVLTAGTYTYSMSLLDPDGDEIEFLAGNVVLAVGPNVLTLEIDGNRIGAHGVDGPYTLGNVLFFGGGASVVAGVVATTGPYTFDQFEIPQTVIPYDVDFESFSAGPLPGQMGWLISAGVDLNAVVVSTLAPLSGVNSVEMHRDPGLPDGTTWGVFSPPMSPTPELEQELSVQVRIEGTGGPSYELLVQSPTDGFVVAWIRFAADGDVQVLQPFGGPIVFVSTGFDWLGNIGTGAYFEVVFKVNELEPVSNQVSIEVAGTTVFSGTALGSTFLEQLALVTDNTGPDVAFFVDDIQLVQRFIQNDCNGNGVPDACDIADGTSLDCNGDGIPNECDPDCNGNGTSDPCDILDGISLDCNGNEVPDDCDIAAGTSADCNGNGIPDECDIASGFSLDCNENGVPDDCDVLSGTSPDCNGNGIPDECDIASGFSLDCNTNGVPDDCDLIAGTSPDCNGNGIPDECDIASGFSLDCNTNGVPDDCDLVAGTSPDCNGNGIPDECDIASGFSLDCNTNGVPDDCDLVAGTSLDCNSNEIPDECDIASGTSLDCNSNSVPDECDIAAGTSSDCNDNQIPDECDIISGFSEDLNGDGVPDECNEFIRGDASLDGLIDLADAIQILDYLTGTPSVCLDALDANDDGALNIVDPIFLLSYIFSMGAPPPGPFGACGPDPTLGDPLNCLGPVPACP